jgi:LacI family transcriptional regulator
MKAVARTRVASEKDRPTIYDVARTAGVSSSTVSRSLSGAARVAPETQRRISRAIEHHHYELNSIARGLATRMNRTLAVLLPDITNPFFPALVRGIQRLADERGFALLLCQTGYDSERERRYLELVRQQRVAGIISIGVDLDGAKLDRYTPIVSLDRRIKLSGSAVVEIDNRLGGILAIEHLTGLGHTQIACMLGPRGLYVSSERAAGWRAGLNAAGVRPRRSLTVTAGFTEEAGAIAVDRLLASGVRFTALVTANDLCALGAIARLREHRLMVPTDVSVVGFDGISLGDYTFPPLTTVSQPVDDMGYRAAEILIDRVESPDVPEPPPLVLFQPKLVIRGSTAPPQQQISAGRS